MRMWRRQSRDDASDNRFPVAAMTFPEVHRVLYARAHPNVEHSLGRGSVTTVFVFWLGSCPTNGEGGAATSDTFVQKR